MDNNWMKSYNGELLIVGKTYEVNGQFYTYAGDFDSVDDVPRTICCFTMGDEFRLRKVIPNFNVQQTKVVRRNRPGDENPINTVIKDTDNELMVKAKAGLKYKEVTRGDFKNSYEKDSDMHNALWCIENQDTLSWARFTDLCNRFGIGYTLTIYDAQDPSKVIDNFGFGGN